jgi:non-ribosomal peptide synthetase component E (peptide arylation enzyme)
MLVHTILEKSARIYPDKVALVCGNERLTYKEIGYKAICFSS